MIHPLKFLTVAVLLAFADFSAVAQNLQLSTGVALPGKAVTQQSADFVVALVNSEPITNTEVQREAQRVLQQLAQQRRPLPDTRTLVAEMLESLINKKLQLQLARDSGIRVEDAAVEQAELSIAAQNQFDLAELRKRVQGDGMSVSQFHNQLREQILLQRLREREVAGRVRVSEQEIDQYMQAQQSSPDLSKLQLHLAQIVVPVPESPSPEQLATLQATAQKILLRVRAGEDAAVLLREFAGVIDRASAGSLGLRTADRYPALFVEATRALAAGDVAELVRSPAGFHVLKVLQTINPALPSTVTIQSHARHILLRTSAQLSAVDARAKLEGFKKRVQTGQAEFAQLAKEHSQDGSAAQGGDLGWASPGMFVPEFESVMNSLAAGELSEPLLSRFGVHLIQLLERRQVKVSLTEQREAVRAIVQENKLEEAYRNWEQTQRGRAFVEMREAPL
jgi:peptidyl-prolyl cis-trans isomerase SurA